MPSLPPLPSFIQSPFFHPSKISNALPTHSFGGPEYSINQIFALARRTAPCHLIFEDIDTLITPNTRSYFLNEVDGLRANDGIFIVASTNHLEQLDPGIAKRPSRFDRKYLFPDPDERQREAYARFWQGKLAAGDGDGDGGGDPGLDFPDKVCHAFARITAGFSFAYMQEAFVAALLAIAARQGGDNVAGAGACAAAASEHGVVGSTDGQGGLAVASQSPPEPRRRERAEEGMAEWRAKFGLPALERDVAMRKTADVCERAEAEEKDDGGKDIEDVLLWKELKRQVKILRDEMTDDSS